MKQLEHRASCPFYNVIDTFSRRRYFFRKRLRVITFGTAQAMEPLERIRETCSNDRTITSTHLNTNSKRGDRALRSGGPFFNSLLALALYGGTPCHC